MKNDKKKLNINLYALIVGIILAAYAISLIFPLLLGLMQSFRAQADYDRVMLAFPDFSIWKNQAECYANDPEFFAMYADYRNVFGNYTKLFSELKVDINPSYRYGWNFEYQVSFSEPRYFIDFVVNTLLIAGVGTIIKVLSQCIMGYLCAKFTSKFTKFIYAFVVFVMIMPIVGSQPATLSLLKRLSIHDTMWGLWLREMNFTGVYFLIFYAFFVSLPDTYSEAAEIDGASYFKVMWTIYIPFAIKMISTIFLIQFVAAYNSYDVNLVFMPSFPTLAYATWKYTRPQAGPKLFAACYIMSLPMFLFFIVFKNKLMGNVTLGGLKG